MNALPINQPSFSKLVSSAAVFGLLVLPSIASCQSLSSDEGKVQDSPRVISVAGGGDLTVFGSMNHPDKIFYVGPTCQFLVVDHQTSDVVRVGVEAEGKTAIQMRLSFVSSVDKQIVANAISEAVGKPVPVANIGNLRIQQLRVSVNEDVARKYGASEFKINTPQLESAINLAIKCDKDKAVEFASGISKGDVVFNITYTFNGLSLDSAIRRITNKTISTAKVLQDFKAKGLTVLDEEQFAEASQLIVRDLSIVEIESLGGTIERPELSLNDLAEFFQVKDLSKQNNEQLARFEARILEQFDPKIDKKQFQPFQIQRRVLDILNRDSTMNEKRTAYSKEYEKNKKVWNSSAANSFGIEGTYKQVVFGGSTGNSSDYSKDVLSVTDFSNFSDDEFKSFLKKYHRIESPNDIEDRFRGLKIYDLTRIEQVGEVTITQARIKPTLKRGKYSVTRFPSRSKAIKNSSLNQKILHWTPVPGSIKNQGPTTAYAFFSVLGPRALVMDKGPIFKVMDLEDAATIAQLPSEMAQPFFYSRNGEWIACKSGVFNILDRKYFSFGRELNSVCFSYDTRFISGLFRVGRDDYQVAVFELEGFRKVKEAKIPRGELRGDVFSLHPIIAPSTFLAQIGPNCYPALVNVDSGRVQQVGKNEYGILAKDTPIPVCVYERGKERLLLVIAARRHVGLLTLNQRTGDIVDDKMIAIKVDKMQETYGPKYFSSDEPFGICTFYRRIDSGFEEIQKVVNLLTGEVFTTVSRHFGFGAISPDGRRLVNFDFKSNSLFVDIKGTGVK